MVAFGKPTIEEWQADVLVDSLALSSDVPAGQLFPNDVRWSRTNSAAVSLVAPFRPAIFEIRDGDHPYRFSTGDDQVAMAGGWATLSAHRQARRQPVGF